MTAPARVFVLPPDVELLRADDLPGAAGVGPGEVVVLRPGSRERPRALAPEAAALLERFRTPRTLADAVLDHCADRGGDPRAVLDSAFPVLVALCRAQLLAPEGSAAAVAAAVRHEVGDRVGPAVLTRLVRALRDSELWRGTLPDGTPVAVKVLVDGPHAADGTVREVTALLRLGGSLAPALLWAADAAGGPAGPGRPGGPAGSGGEVAGRLVLSWCDGEPADLAVRRLGDPVRAADARRRLGLAVLTAYADLHARRVLHGDVHSGNVLVDDAGVVTLVDFGLAVLPGLPMPPRAAGGDAVEPEAAVALLAGRPAPAVTAPGEQYAVAALVWRLLTDGPHLDLDPERVAGLRQVAEGGTPGLAERGAPAWPAGEAVLRRALARRPADRWPSMAALQDAFAAAAAPAPLPAPPSWRAALDELEVDRVAWRTCRPARAAAVAWALQRCAVLTGDIDAADLAAAWAARAGEAATGLVAGPVLAAHALLAEHRRTGAAAALDQARAIAAALPGDDPYHCCRGPLARLLLATECSDPWQARRPPGLVATELSE